MSDRQWHYRFCSGVVLGTGIFVGSCYAIVQRANNKAKTPIEHSTCYQEGREAYEVGLPPTVNPYNHPWTRPHWLRGYVDAKKESLQSMK